jgi:hemolysin activation/secretion protein
VNIRQLERSLLLINDLPGVDARSVLSPSRTQPGAADLLIMTERNPFDAMIGADNFGTRYLGPLQVTAAGSLNSVLGLNERITAQMVMTPDHELVNEMAYFGFNYEQPLWDQGTTFEVFNSYTFTDPGYTLAQFDVSGRSAVFGARVSHPFIRSRNVNMTGRVSFDMRNTTSSNNIEPRREDKIRAIRAGGRFEFTDTLMSVAYNLMDVEVSRGLKLFGATDANDPNVSRPAAGPEFTKIEIELQRLQRLTDSVNLLLGASGQMADGELYSSEEFGIGGQAYGRGFDPSEIVGDDGISGKIELQWNEPYHVELLQTYQLYSFFDAGHIWNGDAAVPSQETETATSAGFGIRGNFNPMTSAGIMVAVPLNRDVATMDDQDPRWFFNLSQRF